MSDSVEITNPIAGSLKISGANVNTMLTVLAFPVLIGITWITWTHYNTALASDRATAEALVRNNEIIVNSLKESNANTAKALERLAEAQEKTARAQDKTNCLLAIPPDARNRADELCNRILRQR